MPLDPEIAEFRKSILLSLSKDGGDGKSFLLETLRDFDEHLDDPALPWLVTPDLDRLLLSE